MVDSVSLPQCRFLPPQKHFSNHWGYTSKSKHPFISKHTCTPRLWLHNPPCAERHPQYMMDLTSRALGPSLADGLFITAGFNCPSRTLKCHRAEQCSTQTPSLWWMRQQSLWMWPVGSTGINPGLWHSEQLSSNLWQRWSFLMQAGDLTRVDAINHT